MHKFMSDRMFVTLKYTCWALCLPVMLFSYISSRRGDARSRGSRRNRTVEPYTAHKGRRRRALSETLANPQLQCHLLSALPFEVRSIIWMHSFSGFFFHLTVRDRRLCYTLCTSLSPQSCNGVEKSEGCHRATLDNDPRNCKSDYVSMLRTCRKM